MITLHPDKIQISGPKLDGGWKITLSTGQHDAEEISRLVGFPAELVTTVNILEPKDFSHENISQKETD